MDTHDEPKTTNNMYLRTHECIELRPTGKIKGTQKVFFLNSGRVLNILKITPMIDSEDIRGLKNSKKIAVQEGHRDTKQEQGKF